MSQSRLWIDVILLIMATLCIAFVVKYASFSRWNYSWLGRSVMTQKVILALVCLLFPVNSFLMLSDDTAWFKTVQIILFLVFIAALAIDFTQLFEAQRLRFDRTVRWIKRVFRK